jgi:hypothetical protein
MRVARALSLSLLPLLLPLLLSLVRVCTADDYNDCYVGDLRTDDCRYGAFATDADEGLAAEEVVSFSLSVGINWTDVAASSATVEQSIVANIHNGTMRYFYTKLTDRPLEKIVSNVVVYLQVAPPHGRRYSMRACSVANDNSDVDSLKWKDCYMLLVSQLYVGLKVYVPAGAVGAAPDCPSCSSSAVSVSVHYSMAGAVCSSSASSSLSAGNATEVVEGRSYLLFLRDWAVFPAPLVVSFHWPAGSASAAGGWRLGDVSQPPELSPRDNSRRARAVLRSKEEINALTYFSWQPTDFYELCYYGNASFGTVANIFLSLFGVSVVICGCLVILLAWSKYASWQWYGGDFEWDVHSQDDLEDGCPPHARKPKGGAGAGGGFWAARKRMTLTNFTIKNFMYSNNGDDPLAHGSVSGNMDIETSTSRSTTSRGRKKSSTDASPYTPAFSTAPYTAAFSVADVVTMNPLFDNLAEQDQERVDSFKPSVAPKRSTTSTSSSSTSAGADPMDPAAFDWSQFGVALRPASAGGGSGTPGRSKRSDSDADSSTSRRSGTPEGGRARGFSAEDDRGIGGSGAWGTRRRGNSNSTSSSRIWVVEQSTADFSPSK